MNKSELVYIYEVRGAPCASFVVRDLKLLGKVRVFIKRDPVGNFFETLSKAALHAYRSDREACTI